MSKDIRTRYIDDPLRGDLKDFEGIVVLRWEKGFTPARNGICPWLVTGSGLALIPLFFGNKAEAVEWLQNPTKVFVFNGFRLAVVWAKSSLDAQKDFELRVRPGLQASKTRDVQKVAKAAEEGHVPFEAETGRRGSFL